MDVEIGRGKKARQGYGFDDIAIVPSRRTRDPQDVDIGWKLGTHLLELPLLGSAMDGVVSPQTAIALGKLGGLGVLNLEGIFTRYQDADRELASQDARRRHADELEPRADHAPPPAGDLGELLLASWAGGHELAELLGRSLEVGLLGSRPRDPQPPIPLGRPNRDRKRPEVPLRDDVDGRAHERRVDESPPLKSAGEVVAPEALHARPEPDVRVRCVLVLDPSDVFDYT